MKVVYVIYSQTHDAVKIGYASNLESRVSTIQISSPEKLDLLMTLTGGKELEKIIHAKLVTYRLSGEWFRWSPQVLQILQEIQTAYIQQTTKNPAVYESNYTYKEVLSGVITQYFVQGSGRPRTRIPLKHIRNVCTDIDLATIKSLLQEMGFSVKKDSNGIVYFYKTK